MVPQVQRSSKPLGLWLRREEMEGNDVLHRGWDVAERRALGDVGGPVGDALGGHRTFLSAACCLGQRREKPFQAVTGELSKESILRLGIILIF